MIKLTGNEEQTIARKYLRRVVEETRKFIRSKPSNLVEDAKLDGLDDFFNIQKFDVPQGSILYVMKSSNEGKVLASHVDPAADIELVTSDSIIRQTALEIAGFKRSHGRAFSGNAKIEDHVMQVLFAQDKTILGAGVSDLYFVLVQTLIK